MKILTTLLKWIGSIFLLAIPFILIYWILSTIDLAPLKFLTSMIESLLNPFLKFIKAFAGDKSFHVGDLKVNLAPIFLCIVCLIIYLAFILVAHLLSMFDNSVSFVSAKTKLAYSQKQTKDSKIEEEKRILDKNTGYVVINFKQQTTSSAYLTSSGLSKADISEKFMDIVSKFELLDAKKIDSSNEEQVVLMFQDVSPSVNYALSLQENIITFNRQLDKAGVRLLVNVGIFCTHKNESLVHATKITIKVANLAAPGEVTCSKDVKDIFERTSSNHFVKFVSKGMYDLGGEIEIFNLKKSN